MSHDNRANIELSRRTLLAATAGGAVALAGCTGGDQRTPDPVSLDEGQTCDNCDMVIEMHPGPVGEAYYLEDAPDALPDDRPDGLAHFCSSSCTYNYVFEQEDQGYDPAVMYGTDYSSVEYDLSEDAGTTVISAHRSADAFAPLADLTLVVDSDVEGAMGASLIGFSDADDAEAFADEHGGDLFAHDEVTRDVIGALGM